MYNALKTQLSELLGITKDALHIHLGLASFFGVALLFRRSLASWIPWLALLVFEIANGWWICSTSMRESWDLSLATVSRMSRTRCSGRRSSFLRRACRRLDVA